VKFGNKFCGIWASKTYSGKSLFVQQTAFVSCGLKLLNSEHCFKEMETSIFRLKLDIIPN